MFCSACGTPNDDRAFRCVNCGEPLLRRRLVARPTRIPNYLVQSILATLFCCLPVGIVSIIYAAQVNGKIEAGDIRGAIEASRNARIWSQVAIGLGILVGLICISAVAAGGLFIRR